MQLSLFEVAATLIGLSALFGFVNERVLRLPHTIGVLLIALATSVSIIAANYVLPGAGIDRIVTDVLHQIDFPEILMHGMLSFLLFAGALHVDFSAFRRRYLAIVSLATVGVLMSSFVVAGMLWILGPLLGLDVPFLWALVFGALISPTDPVAVLGIFKLVKVPSTLKAKMEGESLFNDGFGVVLFTIVVAMAGSDANAEPVALVDVFLVEVVGGAALGLIAGWIGNGAMRQIDEHNLEVMITLAIVMVTYAVAVRLDVSGPIAMVVAGMWVGNRGMQYAVSDNTRDYIQKFWSLIDEILNSVLFLLIGLEVLLIADSGAHFWVSLVAIPVTLFARWVSVAIPISILSYRETFTKGAVLVMTWGGLRGGIAVALALSLPTNEYKATILSATYAVVLFSIAVQGLSVKALVQRVVPDTVNK